MDRASVGLEPNDFDEIEMNHEVMSRHANEAFEIDNLTVEDKLWLSVPCFDTFRTFQMAVALTPKLCVEFMDIMRPPQQELLLMMRSMKHPDAVSLLSEAILEMGN